MLESTWCGTAGMRRNNIEHGGQRGRTSKCTLDKLFVVGKTVDVLAALRTCILSDGTMLRVRTSSLRRGVMYFILAGYGSPGAVSSPSGGESQLRGKHRPRRIRYEKRVEALCLTIGKLATVEGGLQVLLQKPRHHLQPPMKFNPLRQ